jgi:ATP synthase protein I
MSSNRPKDTSPGEPPEGDPWAAFGYLVAGVGVYGAIGFGLSVWLGGAFWVPVGILVGAAIGMYMVFARYRFRPSSVEAKPVDKQVNTPIDHDRRAGDDNAPDRAGRDDRGEAQ